MKKSNFLLPIFFLGSICPIVTFVASCSNKKTNPYENTQAGQTWTINNKNECDQMIEVAKARCMFGGEDLFSTSSVSQEKSTILYWEYANCIAQNAKAGYVSMPYTFKIETSSIAWYSSFGAFSSGESYETWYIGDDSIHSSITLQENTSTETFTISGLSTTISSTCLKHN